MTINVNDARLRSPQTELSFLPTKTLEASAQ